MTHLSRMLVLLFAVNSSPTMAQAAKLVAQRDLIGHSAEGRQVVFSPDGQTLATSSVDHTVRMWRVADGKLLRTLVHPEGVTSIAFSGDGISLVSGSYDRIVRLWHVADGSLVREFPGHAATVWSVAFSPDGQTIASSGEDKTVRLWRVNDGVLLHTLTGHVLNVWHVTFSPDGRIVASSSFDKTLKLWSVTDGRLLRTLTGHKEAIVGFAFSPDGALIASGSDDSSVKLWRVSDGRLIRTIPAGNHVYSVAFTADGQWLAGAGRARSALGTLWHQIFGDRLSTDGQGLRLWRVKDGALQDTKPGNDQWSVATSPDGGLVATSGEDKIMRLWRLQLIPATASR